MNWNLTPFAIGWAVLATIVIVLAIYRKRVAAQEDDIIHLEDTSGTTLARQMEIARKLDTIDRWGKSLTVVALIYGLALGAAYLYRAWLESSRYLG
ncbi:MAG TPA: hypothetical protein VNJ11_14020 [Bryobacteraceae bacterium]|nr:hypothetical protein [Bryobacteraceae bacterium]